MKSYIIFAAALLLSLSLTGCSKTYRTHDFLGKTSAEIISTFGSFDCTTAPADEDGAYKNCRCGYTIKDVRSGFFGQSDEVLFFIQFDAHGVAAACSEGPRPGG